MTQHTRGPWQVVPAGKAQSRWIVGDSEGGSIADCQPPGPWMSDEEADANARLIAAVPNMLAALREILPWHDSHPAEATDNRIVNLCRAAIAKATGEGS